MTAKATPAGLFRSKVARQRATCPRFLRCAEGFWNPRPSLCLRSAWGSQMLDRWGHHQLQEGHLLQAAVLVAA